MSNLAKIERGQLSTPTSTPPYELTVCLLGQHKIALPTEFIQEIAPTPAVFLGVPPGHATCLGVMELRGLLLPTFCLASLLRWQFFFPVDGQKVLVCRLLGFRVGLLVDAILENISLPPEFIQFASVGTAFVLKTAYLGANQQLLPILEMGLLTSQLQGLLNDFKDYINLNPAVDR